MHVELVRAETDANGEEVNGCETECAHFLQSPFWARFKSHHGWTPYRFTLTVTDSPWGNFSASVSVLVRTFLRIFSVAYVPLGIAIQGGVLAANGEETESGATTATVTDSASAEAAAMQAAQSERVLSYVRLLKESSRRMRLFLPPNTVFVRFDPPLCYTPSFTRDTFLRLCKKGGAKKACVDIQPPDTVHLDLTQNLDAILTNMKSKWRYNIRLAEKKGVTVTKCGKEAIDTFYCLYEETSKRDAIALHAKSYYTDLFDTADAAQDAEAKPKITLYVAEYEHTPIAAIITLFTQNEAVYLYGASSNAHRNVMPAYLLQWTAIQDARDYGSRTYDFYGIPPTDDEHHPMHGLYRFKTGFGGAIVHRVGSVDVPLSVLYAPYTVAENLRLVWFKKVKKFLVKLGKK